MTTDQIAAALRARAAAGFGGGEAPHPTIEQAIGDLMLREAQGEGYEAMPVYRPQRSTLSQGAVKAATTRRRKRVRDLHAQGLGCKEIASALKCCPNRVYADHRAMGLPYNHSRKVQAMMEERKAARQRGIAFVARNIGRPARELAAELGVHENTILDYRRAAREAGMVV